MVSTLITQGEELDDQDKGGIRADLIMDNMCIGNRVGKALLVVGRAELVLDVVGVESDLLDVGGELGPILIASRLDLCRVHQNGDKLPGEDVCDSGDDLVDCGLVDCAGPDGSGWACGGRVGTDPLGDCVGLLLGLIDSLEAAIIPVVA